MGFCHVPYTSQPILPKLSIPACILGQEKYEFDTNEAVRAHFHQNRLFMKMNRNEKRNYIMKFCQQIDGTDWRGRYFKLDPKTGTLRVCLNYKAYPNCNCGCPILRDFAPAVIKSVEFEVWHSKYHEHIQQADHLCLESIHCSWELEVLLDLFQDFDFRVLNESTKSFESDDDFSHFYYLDLGEKYGRFFREDEDGFF